MKTGLSRSQKSTKIYFDEKNEWIEVETHNTQLKKRLYKYSETYPEECRVTDCDDHGQCTFLIRKGRLSFRLTAPYSEERKRKIGAVSQKYGINSKKMYAPLRSDLHELF